MAGWPASSEAGDAKMTRNYNATMSNARSTTDGPLKCPACGYPLIHLPAWHTCPECGFAYDPHARVHVIRDRAAYISQIAWAIFISMGLTYFHFRVLRKPLDQDIWWIFAFLTISTVYPIYRLARLAGRPASRVLINHQGIRFEYPRAEPKHVRWEQFGRARYSWITGQLELCNQAGQSLLRWRDRNIGTPSLRRKLAAQINDLAGKYRSS